MISSRKISDALISLNLAGTHSGESTANRAARVGQAFVTFVQKYHLEGQLPAILRHLKTGSDKEVQANTLVIETPHPLDPAAEQSVKKFVGVPAHARVENTVDERLIGGFRAYWKDTRIDGSVESTLRRLEKTLLLK